MTMTRDYYFYICIVLVLLPVIINRLALSATVKPGSTSTYDRNGLINITRPIQSKIDDLLFLFLSRSDDGLPVKLDGWTPVASCLKHKNSARTCRTIEDCSLSMQEDVREDCCYAGADLRTVVFF